MGVRPPLGVGGRGGDVAIVVCADGKYFPAAYVLCLSLVQDQPERYDIYLLTEAGPHLDPLPRDLPFTVQTPDFVDRLPDIPGLINELGPFTFLRLFVGDFFEGYRRILYLDCDIRIDGSIAPLLQLDMKGAAVAAADDVMTYWHPGMQEGSPHPHLAALAALGRGLDEPYFNAGVLLIDCERWKRGRLTAAAIESIKRLGPTLHRDQDALNIVLGTQWLPLSPRWNFPAVAFETAVEAAIKPVVYHHTYLKPWIFGRAVRREVMAFHMAIRRTPYRTFGERPSLHQLKRLAEGRAKRLIQNATFFLPSSWRRIQAHKALRIERYRASRAVRSIATYLLDNARSRRFADVNQGISTVDIAALSSLICGCSPGNERFRH